MAKEIIIFKTGKIYELDLVSNALKEANIPYYRQEETSGGLKLAMSVTPAMGPGNWYSIIVTESVLNDAKKILETLPIETKTNPGVWDFSPKNKINKLWKIFAISIILIYIVILFLELLRN